MIVIFSPKEQMLSIS